MNGALGGPVKAQGHVKTHGALVIRHVGSLSPLGPPCGLLEGSIGGAQGILRPWLWYNQGRGCLEPTIVVVVEVGTL